ncbi:hypothetical protein AKJ09_11256 [Labilithrix luteola]|uniref:Uncharacterized protein n=1 Tax=Labilithrix luteola TaxID=1391654 RepID=A0A0K1QFU3_9BACT|nr:hypothetical protein AKJ09_11256 [Labilithrix luteola]
MLATLATCDPRAARADAEPSVTLDWSATEADCPDGSHVVGEVERILGNSTGPRRRVTARADVTRTTTGGFRVMLVTRGADVAGRRTFEAESCPELASASALILAITVNPQLSSAPPVRAEESSDEPVPASPASERANAEPAPQNAATHPPDALDASGATDSAVHPAPSGRRHFGAGVSFAGDVGSLPSADGGVEATLAWVGGSASESRPQEGFFCRRRRRRARRWGLISDRSVSGCEAGTHC